MAVAVAGLGASAEPSARHGTRAVELDRPPSRAWVPAAVAHVTCFGALALLYTQAPAGFPQPPFWSPRAGHSADVATLYRAALGLPFVPLTHGQFAAAHQLLLAGALISAVLLLSCTAVGVPRGAIWRAGLVLAAIAVLMPPLYSTDVFYYGISGEAVARVGANPYVVAPSTLGDSALLRFNYWDIPSPYGPVWTSVSALIARLGAFDPLRVTLLFKLLGAASVLGTAWLLGRCLDPTAGAVPLALLLLNPVVWIEAVANAHLDALMLLLGAGAVAALTHRRSRLAWVCLLLATWVKYLVAPVLVLHVAARIRREARGGTSGVAMIALLALDAAVLSVAAWLPYWAGATTFASLTAESGRGFSSPLSLAALSLATWLGLADAERAVLLRQVLLVGASAWLGLWLGLLVWLWRRPGGPTLHDEVCAWGVLLMALPVALPRSHPWHMLVALGLLPFAWQRAPRLVLAAHAVAALWVFARYVPV